uniref:Magnesium-dependent phosphatase-1 n=1 Tax=Coccolithus braarudii TaxID=221442 RepID=A0A7S0Q3I5_9EUKA
MLVRAGLGMLAFSSPMTRRQPRLISDAVEGPRPSLCVLDLDMCMWRPEMYELWEMPSKPVTGNLHGRGDGVVGVMSGFETIQLFPGALAALQEVYDGMHGNMRLAVASSADTPRAVEIGKAAMKILEVVPGATFYDVLMRGWQDECHLQIGRSPPLSSDKSQTHFPILREKTGIPYEEMLFFDDSAWSDHCRIVEMNCKGVVTQRTPRGMQLSEWRAGLTRYAKVTTARGM